MCVQIAAAATQFNAYPYKEADKKTWTEDQSPHRPFIASLQNSISAKKAAIVINIQIKVSSADSQKTNVRIQLHATERAQTIIQLLLH